jgi:TolA-binding protein
MKQRIFAFGLAAALVAAAAAPAAAADKETRQMMMDIRMLQEQEQQIQGALAALTDSLKALNASVTAKIDEQTEATRRGMADEKTVTTSISNDLRALREKIDDNTTRVGQNTAEILALRQLITARTSLPPADAGAAAASAPDAAAAAGAGAAPAGAPPAAQGESPTAMFSSAYGDYASGLYDLAIIGFKAYINSFPDQPQAADAQVYICNSFMQMQQPKFQEAVDACDAAIRNYPKANAAPMAYYRKGLALKALKQTDQARAAFDYIIKTWPDSDEASLARQQGAPDPKKP